MLLIPNDSGRFTIVQHFKKTEQYSKHKTSQETTMAKKINPEGNRMEKRDISHSLQSPRQIATYLRSFETSAGWRPLKSLGGTEGW